MTPELTKEQAAAVTLRGRALLCSAAAGAGKTKVLVERLFSYILDPEDPADADSFLLITFTRAAAGEMRGRIMERLGELCRQYPENEHLRAQKLRVYTAKICTLDAFCREILSENAAAAGLFSGFRIGDAAEIRLLEDSALEETLDALYEEYGQNPSAPFSLLTDTFSDMRGDAVLRELIRQTWEKPRAHPQPMDFLRRKFASFEEAVPSGCKILLDWALEVTDIYRRQYEEILPDLETDEKAAAYLANARQDILEKERLSTALRDGWDETVFAVQSYAFGKLKTVKEQTETCRRFKALRSKWKDITGKFKKLFTGTLDRHHDDMLAVLPVLSALADAAEAFDKTLCTAKERRGVLDFADIEHRVYRLLVQDGEPGELAARIGARFREIMVDEYQDINPLQNTLIDAISRRGQNVFYVGDARQSIYRFQMADPSLFLQKLSEYPRYDQGGTSGARQVLLVENFRSRPEILESVNRVFSRIDCPEMGCLPQECFMRSGKPFPDSPWTPVELLTVAAETGSRIEEEAAAIAARLRRLFDTGEAVPEDCVILMRSPASRVAVFRKALAAERLDCLAPGGDLYFERPEIMTVLSSLQIIDNPLNDIALLSVLRSPIAGLTPDDLVELRTICSRVPLYDCLQASAAPRAVAFAEKLGHWRALSADLPPYELCARIMAETALPGQYEGAARNNLLLLPEVLLGYAGNDLRGLSDWLCKLEETGGGLPPVRAEKGNAVSIMSIHKSKGLQFPVVIVADLAKRFNTQDLRERLLIHPKLGFGPRRRDGYSEYPTAAFNAVRHVMQREMRSEELRLLYVAMTRAKRKLILSVGAMPSDPPGGFVSKADVFFAGSAADWLLEVRDPLWPVYENGHAPAPPSAVPAEAAAPPETDPGRLTLLPYSAPQAVLFPSKLTATGLTAFLSETGTAQSELPEGSAPASAGKEFRLPRLTEEAKPLNGAERGTAVHLFMQFSHYSECTTPEKAEAERDRLLREGYLTDRQVEAVDLSKIVAFWNTDTGRLLLETPSLRRERQFSLTVGAGDIPGLPVPEDETVLLQGVIDCYYETEEGLHIIDFKTDFVRPGKETRAAERYRPQMDAYAAALRLIYPQKTVVSRQIVFFHTLRTVLL